MTLRVRKLVKAYVNKYIKFLCSFSLWTSIARVPESDDGHIQEFQNHFGKINIIESKTTNEKMVRRWGIACVYIIHDEWLYDVVRGNVIFGYCYLFLCWVGDASHYSYQQVNPSWMGFNLLKALRESCTFHLRWSFSQVTAILLYPRF